MKAVRIGNFNDGGGAGGGGDVVQSGRRDQGLRTTQSTSKQWGPQNAHSCVILCFQFLSPCTWFKTTPCYYYYIRVTTRRKHRDQHVSWPLTSHQPKASLAPPPPPYSRYRASIMANRASPNCFNFMTKPSLYHLLQGHKRRALIYCLQWV